MKAKVLTGMVIVLFLSLSACKVRNAQQDSATLSISKTSSDAGFVKAEISDVKFSDSGVMVPFSVIKYCADKKCDEAANPSRDEVAQHIDLIWSSIDKAVFQPWKKEIMDTPSPLSKTNKRQMGDYRTDQISDANKIIENLLESTYTPFVEIRDRSELKDQIFGYIKENRKDLFAFTTGFWWQWVSTQTNDAAAQPDGFAFLILFNPETSSGQIVYINDI